MGAPTPTFIPEPFASAAAAGNITFPIPTAAPAAPNGASWALGFPPDTMQPEVAGGLPPFGQDFNGILYTITQALYALQAGQFYGFNASFVLSIVGYNLGAILEMGDGTGLWINTAAGNTTNPDVDATAAGWVSAISYGKAILNGLIGGIVTLLPSQSRRRLIILNGVLTSNLTLVFPPQLREWLLVNNTTGNFTTTAQMAGAVGGVVIPQGGPTAPIGVYCDGVNVYESSSPLTVPIAQAATPLTLAERDNTGQGFFTRVNLSSNAHENPAVGAVLVQNATLDGYGRWVDIAAFLGLFNPTPANALGTSAGGWRKNLDGSIEQWGSFFYQGTLGTQTFVFPTPFTSRVLNITFTSSVGGFTPGWNANTLNGFTAQFNGMGGTPQQCYWRAIGV